MTVELDAAGGFAAEPRNLSASWELAPTPPFWASGDVLLFLAQTGHEFGPLWEARDTYRRLSPLSYAEHVTAPTLILHGEMDLRVPYKNAEQWFRALKMRGVPVELVRYPRSGHGIREPWLAVDRLARIRSRFVHWLDGEPG